MNYKFKGKTKPYAHQLQSIRNCLGKKKEKKAYAILWKWVQVNLKY